MIEPFPGAVVDEAEVIAFCTARIAGYKKPSAVRVVDSLPRTAAGKPRKFVLRERFAGLRGDTSARGLSDRTVGVRRREKQHHQGVEPTVGRGER